MAHRKIMKIKSKFFNIYSLNLQIVYTHAYNLLIILSC